MNNPEIPALFEERIVVKNPSGHDERYEYAKGRQGTAWYFVKTARSKRYNPHIQREVVWNEFMNRVEAFYPAGKFVGPRIERRIGEGGLVFDFVDAPLLADGDELIAWQANISRYAEMLETFDRVAVNWKAENLPDEPSRSLHIYSTWQGWLDGHLDEVKYLNKARHLVETASFKMTRCLQHGGPLTPRDIFVAGERWLVFDGEHCGSDLFRYTDLADGYARLYAYYGAKASATELLQNFMQRHERPREDFLEEFIPVLAHRSVALLSDAFADKTRDYVGDAEELLQLCVDTKIEKITG